MSTGNVDSEPVGDGEMSFPSYVELVFGVVLVWGFGDALSTLLALSSTGTAALETNPLMRPVLAYDPLALVAVKGAVALVVGLALLRYRSAVRGVPGWRAWLSGVLALGIVVAAVNVAVAVLAL